MRLVVQRFGLLAAAAALVGIALALWTKRDALDSLDSPAVLLAFAASSGVFAVAPLVQALLWSRLLRAVGARPPGTRALVVWTRSFLLRYAPSGALGYALRIRERGRLRASATQIWIATAYEQLVALGGGASVCSIAFVFAGASVPRLAIAGVVAAATAMAVLHPRVAEVALGRLLRGRLVGGVRPLGTRFLVGALAASALAWLPTAAGVALLTRSLVDEPPSFAWLLGAYAVAWLAGFLIPFLPAGLGARDTALAAILAGPLGTATAIEVALALRLANTIGELAAAALAEGAHRYTSESNADVPRAPRAGEA